MRPAARTQHFAASQISSEQLHAKNAKAELSLPRNSEMPADSDEGSQLAGKRPLQSQNSSGRWTEAEHLLFLEGNFAMRDRFEVVREAVEAGEETYRK